MITGLNGRTYDATGKKLEQTVSHPETRTPKEVRRAAQPTNPGSRAGFPTRRSTHSRTHSLVRSRDSGTTGNSRLREGKHARN